MDIPRAPYCLQCSWRGSCWSSPRPCTSWRRLQQSRWPPPQLSSAGLSSRVSSDLSCESVPCLREKLDSYFKSLASPVCASLQVGRCKSSQGHRCLTHSTNLTKNLKTSRFFSSVRSSFYKKLIFKFPLGPRHNVTTVSSHI